jgi:hypothetical protein
MLENPSVSLVIAQKRAKATLFFVLDLILGTLVCVSFGHPFYRDK